MHRTITASITAPPSRVGPIVADLGTYPHWLELVTNAEAVSEEAGDVGPAWLITLRARVGPFARSKKLRMVRSPANELAAGNAEVARFVRRETDGRDHASWILETTVTASPESHDHSEVTMDLRYEGGLWSGPLDAVLGNQVDSAIDGLSAYAQAQVG